MPLKKIYLELTNRCNLNCAMCYRKTWHKETKDMSRELLNRCLQQIESISTIQEVVLGGIGEPTIYPQIEDVMRRLKNKHLTMTTNGTKIDDTMVETMVETIDHLVISLDGMEEIFYNIRKFSFDQIISNVQKIINKKLEKNSKTPYLSFQMVLSETNKNEIIDVIDLASSLGVNQVILSNLIPTTKDDQGLILYKMYQNDEIKKLFGLVQNQALKKGLN